jgi:hypothetical protein
MHPKASADTYRAWPVRQTNEDKKARSPCGLIPVSQNTIGTCGQKGVLRCECNCIDRRDILSFGGVVPLPEGAVREEGGGERERDTERNRPMATKHKIGASSLWGRGDGG